MKKKNTSKIVIVIFMCIILVGIGLGIIYSSLPEHHPDSNQLFCEKAGGIWTDNQTCLLSYKKAGDTCTDGGQCISGICFPPILTDEQIINLTKSSLKNVEGTCYPEDIAIGCVPQVIKGTVSMQSMCLNE